MIQKLILGISASALLIGCKADCPDDSALNNPVNEVITLQESSLALNELIKTEDSQFRGLSMGDPISKITEKDEDLTDNDGENVNFAPDIAKDYWADIEYYYDKENIINKLKVEINPFGQSTKTKDDLATKIFDEISMYFNGKYGDYVNTEDYKYVWNNVDTIKRTLTVFTLDYEFPDKEITLVPNPKEGTIDTIYNGITVLLKIKSM